MIQSYFFGRTKRINIVLPLQKGGQTASRGRLYGRPA